MKLVKRVNTEVEENQNLNLLKILINKNLLNTVKIMQRLFLPFKVNTVGLVVAVRVMTVQNAFMKSKIGMILGMRLVNCREDIEEVPEEEAERPAMVVTVVVLLLVSG